MTIKQADTERINEAIALYLHPKPWGHDGHVYDYYTDEAANARLLEAMAQRNSYVWLEWDINEWCVMFKPTTKEEEDCSIEYSHSDRKTAIVLAFCKFAGIEVL